MAAQQRCIGFASGKLMGAIKRKLGLVFVGAQDFARNTVVSMVAYVLVAILALSMFTSAVFVGLESHHVCTGAGCHVCAEMVLIAKLMSHAVIACAGLCVALKIMYPAWLCRFYALITSPLTPIVLKVRLNS
ncbi:hypothetical protein KPC83_03280 [Collinsella sp. zg1085]|uniref:hypothetical protein n=1 Tax=Collinsella sp. zg1085 TaxID=2844380 RepID=UPI001C0D3AD7|nr:hypothetical protein [Collinsella sp. zg1085]QWT18165.1 hypothetical protein KPC83_03280 [Collinsella sp. zg1085]